jgi:hypothetical protein
MEVFSKLPTWVGTAIIAGFFATLGFFGRKLYDSFEARRARKKNAIKQLEKLSTLLDESESVFRNQNFLVRRLLASLRLHHSTQIPSNAGYDHIFYRTYDLMDEQERELFSLIRGTTMNSMRRLNEELRRWADENSAKELLGKKMSISLPSNWQLWASEDPVMPLSRKKIQIHLPLDYHLNLLREHLNGWFDKFESILKTDERRCLVYLADEKGHGQSFPSLLHDVVARALILLGSQSVREYKCQSLDSLFETEESLREIQD